MQKSSAYNSCKWWKKEEELIVCELCPHLCRIAEGKRGFCGVRANIDGKLVSTVYGRHTGLYVDPIEKKPLNHFLPGTGVLSFGTPGCNLACVFCQNWHLSSADERNIATVESSPKDIVESAIKADCSSIAFTYNDPIIWAEYAIDIAKEARAKNIKTVAITSGYINSKAREEFFSFIDAANVDLKSFSENFYNKMCKAHLKPVLDTLVWLRTNTSVWIEVTNLLIPDENDNEDEVRTLCLWLVNELGAETPLHFSAFHPQYKLRDKKATSAQVLQHAYDIAVECGLKFVYLGNICDEKRQSTYCPKCANIVIEREYYRTKSSLVNGCCRSCKNRIAGVFID